MVFLVLKSYDGGKRWERGRGYKDFASAARAALALRAQHPAIRYRVDVETVGLRPAVRKAVRSKRRQR
ncbi:hypothetical protein MYX77_09145 [Acidobacteriia bacterium AH_259_A11_L15]|nr:hypothetical protein [Acidobacteriia bacterium AH_259_A11_L15]